MLLLLLQTQMKNSPISSQTLDTRKSPEADTDGATDKNMTFRKYQPSNHMCQNIMTILDRLLYKLQRF